MEVKAEAIGKICDTNRSCQVIRHPLGLAIEGVPPRSPPAQQIGPTRFSKKAATILTFFALKGGCNSPACEETYDLEHPVQQTSNFTPTVTLTGAAQDSTNQGISRVCAPNIALISLPVTVCSPLISCRHVTAVDLLGPSAKVAEAKDPFEQGFGDPFLNQAHLSGSQFTKRPEPIEKNWFPVKLGASGMPDFAFRIRCFRRKSQQEVRPWIQI